MFRNILMLRVWVVIVVTVLLGTACAPSAAPSISSAVKIEPSASSVQVNDTVNVLIKVENAADLIAFESHLSFDANVLEVVKVINGDFVKADFSVQNTFDNAAGTIDYAIAQIKSAPANGSGTLFEIVFRAKAAGDAPIRFRGTQAAPAGMLLSDSNGIMIQVSLMDGGVSVK